MAKPNYQFEKRQRELEKKRKQEEKRQRDAAAKSLPEGGASESTADAPESVNQDAYAAWLFKMTPDNAADVDALLDAAAYQAVADAA